jgi:hypothetical protein
VFGTITEQTSPVEFLSGEITLPSGVSGTIQFTSGHVAAETHVSPLPASDLTSLRRGDLRSLVTSLKRAMQRQAGIDPLWGRMLTQASDELSQS